MTFKFRVDRQNPQHVHVTLFAGPDEHHLVHSGTMIFHPTEWPVFMLAMTVGADQAKCDVIFQL